MGERRRVGRHAGHRAAEHPQLRDAHRRIGGLEVLDDRLGDRQIDPVDEHRPRDRQRVVALVVGRIDLRVGHRLEHVGERRRERPGTGQAAPGRRLRVAGVRHQREDDELAVVLLGDEGHRRAGHDVGDGRQLLRRGLRRGDETRDHLRRRRQDQHAPTNAGTSWSRYWKRVATPKLPPPPRIAQKRSGWCSASTRSSSPSAVTTSAARRSSIVRPNLRTR